MMDAQVPTDRLSSAYRLNVDPATRERHLAEMSAAIRSAPPAPVPAGFGLRRRVAAAVAAVVIVAPAGMAVAAEEAVPGDLLYPVKEITERARSYFDHDIEATHRVEEVERLLFRRAPGHAVARAVERAEAATMELAESTVLRFRLDRARELAQRQEEGQRVAGRDGSDGSSQESGSTTENSGNSERVGPDSGSGTTAPSRSSGSTEQDRDRSSATGTTEGQQRPEQGSGESSGSSEDSGGPSPTAASRKSGEPNHP